MINNLTFKITKNDLPQRLDKYILKKIGTSSRSLIADVISSGDILLNDKKTQKGKLLRQNDSVKIVKLLETCDIKVIPNKKIKLDIIYEDESLLIINKPSGIPVHPIKPTETDTLSNALVAYNPKLSKIIEDNPLFPAFVHRLDTMTSGVIVAAKNMATYMYMREQFKKRKVKKIYYALVEGIVKKDGEIDNYMAHDPKDKKRMVVLKSYDKARRVLRAITKYTVKKNMESHTVAKIQIKTGVMHQIRCHMASIGHPLVGDKIYNKNKCEEAFLHEKRRSLHAYEIGFIYPRTRDKVTFTSELPNNLK
ncbi:MAG: RluA family pseudouridine synthase [Candidatus Ancaeobacter aquaticus]|nr:RluA family pseudouridine synthase [Candidatus Ancaeobacter aquaticus]